MKTLHRACMLCLALGMSVGCENGRYEDTRSDSRMDLELDPSTSTIVEGETVTVTARVQDRYGHNPRVSWSTTAGHISTEDDGRVARVKFNEPGTYTVSATLIDDGREIEQEFVEIRVRPLR